MQKKKTEKSVILKAAMPSSVFGELIAEYADRMQIMEISNTANVPWHKNKPGKARKPRKASKHVRGAFTNAIMAALKANKGQPMPQMELRAALDKAGFEAKMVYGAVRRLERQKAVRIKNGAVALTEAVH